MRLFYASFLDSENMRAYESLVADISEAAPRALRPVPPRSHHLTMAFVGEVAERDLDKCLEVLAVIGDSPAFDYSLASPRILYARRTPRLICTDVETGVEMVASLQSALRRELLQRFPETRLRSHSPHVTLARFRRNAHPKTARPVSEALSALRPSRFPDSDRLDNVHLVRSTLTSSGPTYETLGDTRFASIC